MNVHDYLEAARRLPWRWGGGASGFEGDDCTLFCANWAIEVCGQDPGIGIRGAYTTEQEAIRIVVRAGGFAAFIDQQLRPLGWIRTSAEPRDGDIGVVLAPTLPDKAMKPAPVIRAGGLWVGRSVHGQTAKQFETVAVWRWGDFAIRDLGPPQPTNYYGMVRSHAQECAGSTMLRPEQEQQTGILESAILLGLTSLGVSGAALNFLVPALAGLAVTAVTTGLQYLLMPKPPRPADGKAPKAQATPSIIFGTGTNRIGGALMLWEAKGLFMSMVSAKAGHRISGVQKRYLNDDEVTLDGDLFVEEGEDGRYSDSGRGLILWRDRVGLPTETAYPEQVADYSAEGLWTNNHRGDGQASFAIRCESVAADQMQKRYPHTIPQPSELLDMALVWDFRDEAQDPEDEDTWEFSKNPALCLAWWLCFCSYGPKWDYTKALLPVIERWQEEADICDEPIDLNLGGTEPRYESHVWATTATDPIAITNAYLAACDGHLAQYGDGSLILTVGKFREELVETVTDADIVGHYIQNDVAEEDEINRLVPRFTYPDTDYTEAVADYFESIPDQLRAGRVLSQDADLISVHSWTQGRRLTWREWQRIQSKKSGNFDFRLSAINAIHARWIRLETPVRLPKLDGTLIENRRSILALMQGGFQTEWKGHPDNIDAWNPATQEGAKPPVPTKPDADGQTTATIDSVLSVANGTSVYLRVIINDPNDLSLIPMTRYRVKDTGGGTPGAWVEQAFPDVTPAAGVITLNTNPVPTDQVLQVQAAFRASGGTASDWEPAPPEEVTSTVDTSAPAALSGVSVSAGLGYVTVNATPALGNTRKVRIWYSADNVLNQSTDTPFADHDVTPGVAAAGLILGDGTRTNIALTPDFASDTNWTKGTGWTIAAGVAHHASGTSSLLRQIPGGFTAGQVYRSQYTVSNYVSGTVRAYIGSATNVFGTGQTANGTYRDSLTVPAGAGGQFGVQAQTSNFVGDIDNYTVFLETPTCLPQGAGYIFVAPMNASGVVGPVSGPHAVTMI